MKKLVKFFKCIIVLLTVITFTQCEKDDSTPSFANNLKMNGDEFNVVSASMTGVSLGVFGYANIIFVSGSGTQTKSLTIGIDSYTQATIEGVYTFPEVIGKKLLDDWITDYTVFDGTTIYTSNLEAGEVSITHNGSNNYTVEINMEMIDGVSFTGSYTGDFQVAFSK